MDTKTPVSALQEYCVKVNTTPTYDLIGSKVGTHNPEFVYCVRVNNLSERGTGKSKQEAKHRAAEKLLKALNINTEAEIPDQFNNTELTPGENYVGQLKEYCYAHLYPLPVFKVEEEAGPPHSKIFKLTCNVSKLSEYGISKTKKQAKQLAAHNMLQHLKKTVKEKESFEEVCNTDSEDAVSTCYIRVPPKTITTEEVIAKQMALKSCDTVPKSPLVYYKDHERAYLGLEEGSETLKKILTNEFVVSEENALNLLESVCRELGAALKVVKEKIIDGRILVFLCVSNDSEWPSISGLGENENSAAAYVLTSFKVLCSK